MEFKDTFCVSLFKETKYTTSLKPNLLAGLFQNDITISCSFVANNTNKKQYIFAKQGIVDSGVYIENDKIVFELALNKGTNNFSDETIKHTYNFEYDKKYSIIYSIDVEKHTFKTYVNDLSQNTLFEGNVSDYSNVPLWIGTSNPFVENKNYFNGIISKFEIVNDKGIVCDIDFEIVNRFKVLDKSGNGNHAYIEEFGNKTIQIKLNKLLAGNSLETKDVQNVKKTLV